MKPRCILCDQVLRPTKKGLRHIHLIDGGRPRKSDEPAPEPGDPADAGWHPVGPSCYRRLEPGTVVEWMEP